MNQHVNRRSVSVSSAVIASPSIPFEASPHHADVLSFMRRRKPAGTGIDYWVVESSGNYTRDCARGHELAEEYLRYIGNHPTHGNATLLGCIVDDMVRARK